MNRLMWLLMAALLLPLALVTPSSAALVTITAAAPLDDQSDEAVQAAIDQAVGQAVDGAIQMGLRPVHLADAEIWLDRVVVEVLATEDQRDEGGDGLPGLSPGEHLAYGQSDDS
jgi:hypothetical protein